MPGYFTDYLPPRYIVLLIYQTASGVIWKSIFLHNFAESFKRNPNQPAL